MSDKLDLRQAAKYLGIGEQYMRVVLRKNLVPSTMEPIAEGSATVKHMIKVEDLDAFRDRETGRTGARADGRNRYLIYLRPDERETLSELLAVHLPEVELRRATQPKKPAAEPLEEDEEE